MFIMQLRRELLLANRSRYELANPLIFFVMISCLLPFAVGSEPEFLARLAGGVIWMMALLASLLSLDQLFRSDFDDGTLDQFLLSPYGLFWPVLAKIIVHWLVTGLPLMLISPLLAMMLGLPAAYDALMFSLFAGTLYFSSIGAIGAALTASLRKSGLLLSLIIMPFYIPILILGAGSIMQVMEGYNATGPLLMLAALSVFAVAFSPMIIIAALRIGADG